MKVEMKLINWMTKLFQYLINFWITNALLQLFERMSYSITTYNKFRLEEMQVLKSIDVTLNVITSVKPPKH